MGSSSCKMLRSSSSRVVRKKSTSTGTSEKIDYIEDVVCEEKDLKENEMKVFPLGNENTKVLLIKQKGEIHALGTKCTHYGALLNTGALGDGRVRCPWHGACFNIKTGDIEDHPGLDSLPCHKVTVDDSGLVHVRAKRTDLEMNKRIKETCPFDANNKSTVVIVGGGPAGVTCAQTLREEGFTGNIIMISKENVLPYDRVKVSKVMDFDIEKSSLRPKMFYEENNIQTKLGIEATGIDTEQKLIRLSNNETCKYDRLFICTGSMARIPDIPGVNLKNIFVLRDYTDGHAVHSKLSPDKHVVVLGLGFIGMEAAAYSVGKCASVTIIGRDKVPFKLSFGEEIGARMKTEFERKGITFMSENGVTKFIPKEDDQSTIGKVELQDGKILPADIMIIGIGAIPCTDWIKESPIDLLSNGNLNVDKHLKTNVDDIFAGGDIACAPINGIDDDKAAIGHFGLAQYHGRIAAFNICGKEKELNSVPFFWTTLFGKSYRYAGHGKFEKTRCYGSLEKLEFFAFHLNGSKVVAMSSVGADPVVANFANLLHEGKSLTEEEITKDPYGWIQTKPKDLTERFPYMPFN